MNWGYPGYITLSILLALLVLGGSVDMWLHRERVLALFVSKDRVQELTAERDEAIEKVIGLEAKSARDGVKPDELESLR